ncbi:hypothetical protein [Halovivax gelatinilyticus]|uniref:hypothetical protein n=1 Tax=Halovivax gelatinilyticus TaxID=2961597 RepID=UPI00272DD5C7|nr:hypothetical protein [Halovivax gelatinilyticus]
MSRNAHSDRSSVDDTDDESTVEPTDTTPDADGVDGLLPADVSLSIPPSATPEETAAIAAVIGAHLRDRELAASRADETDSWDERRWAFAGRLDAITGRASRVPTAAPRDPWAASGRIDRF